MPIFMGAGVALVTPFHDDGSVNFDRLEAIVEEQIAGGTDCIISCGTTGESATMNFDEHLSVIKRTVEIVHGRIPVIAGTGSNCTAEGIALSSAAEKAGADGLLLVTPYYNKATQNGLIAHFTKIAGSVKIPALLYHVPSRTGTTIKPETAVKLCRDVENIVGIKEASGNLSAIAKMMNLADGCIDLYSGNDDQTVPILSLGGLGVISVLSNVAPAQTHEICQSFFDGDIKRSTKLQLDAIPLVEALFCEVNPIPVKAAMNMLGKNVGPLRLPLTEMEEENKKKLYGAMKDYGLL